MREYIFTEKEREILKLYLEKGTKVYGFYQLMNRINKNNPFLKQDFELLQKVVEIKPKH